MHFPRRIIGWVELAAEAAGKMRHGPFAVLKRVWVTHRADAGKDEIGYDETRSVPVGVSTLVPAFLPICIVSLVSFVSFSSAPFLTLAVQALHRTLVMISFPAFLMCRM